MDYLQYFKWVFRINSTTDEMMLNQGVVGAKGCCVYSGVIQIKYYDVFGGIITL